MGNYATKERLAFDDSLTNIVNRKSIKFYNSYGTALFDLIKQEDDYICSEKCSLPHNLKIDYMDSNTRLLIMRGKKDGCKFKLCIPSSIYNPPEAKSKGIAHICSLYIGTKYEIEYALTYYICE